LRSQEKEQRGRNSVARAFAVREKRRRHRERMVKNKGKGGKNRRRGKADGDMKRELTFKEDGQEYAQVTRMLGNGRLEAFCFDGVSRLCHIRGKLRKRVWIGVGDIVLLGLREFQDQKADIILKYDGDEARSLKTYGELPDTVQINAGTETLEGEEFGDDNFDFDEDADNADDDHDDVDDI